MDAADSDGRNSDDGVRNMSRYIPEHPATARTLRSGFLEKEDAPICPICGGEADDFYIGRFGEILGCSECVERADAWDFCTDGIRQDLYI